MDNLLDEYNKRKEKIDKFLESSREKINDKDDVFFELIFCICVPQSKAPVVRSSLKILQEKDILKKGSKDQLQRFLKGVRFVDKKLDYLLLAREKFDEAWDKITELKENPMKLREWLFRNIKGLGMKESSHFLRNIGLGDNLAILDVHILKWLESRGKKIKTLTPKIYLELESDFINFSNELGLKSAELDITLWQLGSGNEEIM